MISLTTAETILVVDDREAVCEVIEVILGCAGYRVLTATNGTDALQLAQETPQIDLLVSEIEMPDMRGEELAACVTTFHPSARVIFVSSLTGPIESAEPFEFIAKPFTVSDLRNTVRRALRTGLAFAKTSCAA